MTSNPTSLQQQLKERQWKNRVVLLVANSNEQTDLQEQQAIFSKEKSGLQEREIVVIDVQQRQLSASDKEFVEKNLAALDPAFTVLLIGKDGGVKLSSTKPISAEKLFATIDAMPMRQREMKQ